MRLASFFILSVSLHAAALAYPITLARRSFVEAIRVTILPVDEEAALPSGVSNGNGASARHLRFIAADLGRPAPARCCITSAKAERKIQGRSAGEHRGSGEPQAISPAEIPSSTGSDASFASPDAMTDARPGASLGSPAGATGVAGGEMTITGTPGGTSGVGSGSGNNVKGAGSGPGHGAGMTLTQARYSNTPRPEYPESARREGREGRVLLRVLVDERGRSKQVEINSSSGSEALDRAAAEAIRRWRFDPARYGDQPVESWLRIPIEFRLTDAKAW